MEHSLLQEERSCDQAYDLQQDEFRMQLLRLSRPTNLQVREQCVVPAQLPIRNQER